MIKEYFTDGLISLAILLSLFRTDLVGINNLIDYPEVQDVILGQTAAYSPVNFHNYRNAHHVFNYQKHIDLDTEAFTAWYQNVQNLPRFRVRQDNEIEAFLVNVPIPLPPQNIISENQFSTHTDTTNDNANAEEVPPIASPTLPLEGANSFEPVLSSEDVNSTSLPSGGNDNDAEQSLDNAHTTTVDITFMFSNPFPGCNLTKEDLDLIEVLWRQDVDLGVGKEVYDQNLRLELEKERELDLLKEQEKQRAQERTKEKEERQKQEHANRWLRENFMRDGETGEWVRLQDEGRNNASGFNNSHPVTALGETNTTDDFMTLDAALDYISSNLDPDVLKNLETDQQNIALSENGFTDCFLDNTQTYTETPQYNQVAVVPTVPEPPTHAGGYLEHQDSLEANWNGLVDFLSVAASPDTTTTNNGSINNDLSTSTLVTNSIMASPEEHLTSAMVLTSELNAMTPDIDTRGDFLLQNASLPIAADVNGTNDIGVLHPVESVMNSTGPAPNAMEDPMEWDLTGLDLFINLTSGAADLSDLSQANMVEDLDLDGVDNFLLNLEPVRAAKNETETPQEEELSESAASIAGSTPRQDLGDVFDGLEGAIGGTNFSSSGSGDLTDPFSKVSRLSESSSDSGFAYQGGFSSSSSAGSSYAGSPAGSNHSGAPNNHSNASNDTDVDPKGSRTLLARGHVAHNHTYNTPPGQTPREVKKYAPKEPSRKGPHSRDERRAQELKIPFTISEIIDSPVDIFNEMLTKYKLSEPQLSLIRDIRRRGKNKVAAQNCRKRKVGAIVTLSDERLDLQKTRDRLMAERAEMEREMRRTKEKFGHLYTHIFQSLRDDDGQPYDPSQYSLQQSSDGNVFLVPRNVTKPAGSQSSTGPSSNSSSPSSSSPPQSDSSQDSSFFRKRKAYQ